MCCKVMQIPEFESEKGDWCPQCNVGMGCKIYDHRPERCRAFECGYLGWDSLPDYWFPAKAKIVVVSELEGGRLAFHVDQQTPGRWRIEPFYSDIKEIARRAAVDDIQVLVCVGRKVIAVLPDKEVDLGIVHEDERILTGQLVDRSWVARKVHKDDPSIAGVTPGVAFSRLKETSNNDQ
jgi:hypothetical protein